MPWCPNCKSEYVEGIKFCKDCKEPLVDILPIVEQEDFLTDAIDTESDVEIENLLENGFIRKSDSSLYMKASERKEEYSSSILSFVIISFLTLILSYLIFFDKINLSDQPTQKSKYLVILIGITILFFILAFFSYRKSKKLSHSVDKEEEQLRQIRIFFENSIEEGEQIGRASCRERV